MHNVRRRTHTINRGGEYIYTLVSYINTQAISIYNKPEQGWGPLKSGVG